MKQLPVLSWMIKIDSKDSIPEKSHICTPRKKFMRKILLLLSIIYCLISCQKNEDVLIIQGNVKGLKRGALLLQKWDDSLMTTIDSVSIEGNSDFKFTKQLVEPQMFYLTVRLKDGVFMDDEIAFFGEPGVITINTTLERFGSRAQISGSKNDSLWRDYNKLKQRYIEKNLELIEQRLSLTSRNNDSVRIAIERQEQSVENSKHMATVNFALMHNEYEISPYLIINEGYTLRAKFLDTVYQTLEPKIQKSKYGKALLTLLEERKEEEKQ